MPSTIIWAADGQSWYGGVYGGPRLQGIGNTGGRVIMPDDGLGTVGPNDGETGLGQTLPVLFTGFVAADDAENPLPAAGEPAPRELQSIALPAANTLLRYLDDDDVRVLVLSSGANGAPLVGHSSDPFGADYALHLKEDASDSDTFTRTNERLAQAIALCASDGWPVSDVVMTFRHGQDEQTDTQAVYRAKLEAYIAARDAAIAAEDPGIAITWLLTQNGGNITRNDREPRLAIFDVIGAAGFEHVFWGGADYPFAIYDGVHPTSRSKVLAGERDGAYAYDALTGSARVAPTFTATSAGQFVHCTASVDIELEPAFGEGAWHYGFTIRGATNAPRVTAVEQTGLRTFTLYLDAAPIYSGTLYVAHAYRTLEPGEPQSTGFPRGQGAMRRRGVRQESRFLPGVGIYDYFPGIVVPIS